MAIFVHNFSIVSPNVRLVKPGVRGTHCFHDNFERLLIFDSVLNMSNNSNTYVHVYRKVLKLADIAPYMYIRITNFFSIATFRCRYPWSFYEVSFKPLWYKYLLHTYCWVPVCSYQSLCTTTAHINHPHTAALTVCHKQAPERFFQCKTDARWLCKGSLVWVTVIAIFFCTTASKTKACPLYLRTGNNLRVWLL